MYSNFNTLDDEFATTVKLQPIHYLCLLCWNRWALLNSRVEQWFNTQIFKNKQNCNSTMRVVFQNAGIFQSRDITYLYRIQPYLHIYNSLVDLLWCVMNILHNIPALWVVNNNLTAPIPGKYEGKECRFKGRVINTGHYFHNLNIQILWVAIQISNLQIYKWQHVSR